MKRILMKEDFEFLRRHKFILKNTLNYLVLHFPLIDFSDFKRKLKYIKQDFVKLNRVLVKFYPDYKHKKLDFIFDKRISYAIELALRMQEKLSYNIYGLIERKKFGKKLKQYCKSKTRIMDFGPVII